MKNKITGIIVVVILIVVFVWAEREIYSISDRRKASSETSVKKQDAVQYTCPMHHQIISDHPGKCPICSMDLVPIEDGGFGHADNTNISHGAPIMNFDTAQIQKMGVRTDKVIRENAVGSGIRAVGIIAENERQVFDVTSLVEGRVDLKINASGDTVTKGQILYNLYSPELISVQNDYLAAIDSKIPELESASRRRLELIGVQESVIDQIKESKKPLDNVPFVATHDGVVKEIYARSGAYIMPNMTVMKIQNYSQIWIEASIADKDINLIGAGDQAEVHFDNPDKTVSATVDYVYPTINTETRTAKIRLVMDNNDLAFKPGGYADVRFADKVSSSDIISIPSEAILRTAKGNHVITALGNGRFSVRDVKISTTINGRTEILDGLQEGEEVVTSGQFMIDSESSLKESIQKVGSMPNMPSMNMKNDNSSDMKNMDKGDDMKGMEMNNGK